MQTITITAPITEQWARANAKAAAAYRAGVRAERLTNRQYRVPSQRAGHAAHAVEVVSVSRLLAHCDCEAGQYGRPCLHASLALSAAAELIRQASEQAAPTPAAPAAPVAASPARVSPSEFVRRFSAA